MINDQLLGYIKQQLAQGVGKETIQTNLTGSGWAITDISEAFLKIGITNNSGVPIAPATTPIIKTEPAGNLVENISKDLTKKVTNAGTTAELFGLFFIIGSIVCYLLFPTLFFAFLIIFIVQIISGLILIIFGWMIRKKPMYESLSKIYVVLVIGVLVFILDFFILGAISFASMYLIINSMLGISSARKLLSQESLTNEVQKRLNIKNWTAKQKTFDFLKVIIIAVCIIGAFIFIDYVRYIHNFQPPLSSDQSVNAVVSVMHTDSKTKSDYVIDHDVMSLIIKGGSYETFNHMNYSGFCQTATAQPLLDEIAKLNIGRTTGVKCTDGDYGLAVSSSLNNGGYMCFDSSGYFGKQETSLHEGPLCKPLANNAQPTWYVIISSGGNPLTKAKVNAEYDSFLPVDNVGNVQVVAGELPPGITIECLSGLVKCDSSENGKDFLMGAPTKVGTYTFTVAYSNGSYKLTTTFTIIVTK